MEAHTHAMLYLAALGLDLGAVPQQELHTLRLAELHGQVQRRVPVLKYNTRSPTTDPI